MGPPRHTTRLGMRPFPSPRGSRHISQPHGGLPEIIVRKLSGSDGFRMAVQMTRYERTITFWQCTDSRTEARRRKRGMAGIEGGIAMDCVISDPQQWTSSRKSPFQDVARGRRRRRLITNAPVVEPRRFHIGREYNTSPSLENFRIESHSALSSRPLFPPSVVSLLPVQNGYQVIPPLG